MSEYNEDQDLAAGYLYYAKLFCGDWSDLDYYNNLILKNIKENKKPTTPFCSFSITDEPELQYKVAKKFSKKINNKK